MPPNATFNSWKPRQTQKSGTPRAIASRKSGSVAAVKTNNKIEQLSNDIDIYNALSSKDKDDIEKNKEMIQKIKRFEDDPKNPLEELELTFDDRIVFIIATFFVRYITIIMVQWCIDINIIKTFYEGFIYYAVIYIILFWFIVLFINIDNSFDVKYLDIHSVSFYDNVLLKNIKKHTYLREYRNTLHMEFLVLYYW